MVLIISQNYASLFKKYFKIILCGHKGNFPTGKSSSVISRIIQGLLIIRTSLRTQTQGKTLH